MTLARKGMGYLRYRSSGIFGDVCTYLRGLQAQRFRTGDVPCFLTSFDYYQRLTKKNESTDKVHLSVVLRLFAKVFLL